MTRSSLALRASVATDAGLLRSNNEDRAHADEAAGLFLVIDGMGGHAAGEKAAETAAALIPREFESLSGNIETRIRSVITVANNEIFRLAQARDDWFGMACVLTMAVVADDKLTFGHVGDSRLYLAWTGGLRKLTSDHSPVGEREDAGHLTEAEAMGDPRRNQVFRDVGSQTRQSSDPDFIEIKTVPFRPDAALLLCTDGLSDVLTNAEMNTIVQSFNGDSQVVAKRLVDAANHAGGKDNITVIFVAGPEFVGSESSAMAEARARHSVTRARGARSWKSIFGRLLWLAAGAVLGIAGFVSSERFIPHNPSPEASRRITVAAPQSLSEAIAASRPGDVIEVSKGRYAGPIELKEGTQLIAVDPGETVIYASSAAPAITIRNVNHTRLSGFRIEGSASQPLAVGLLIDNAPADVDEIEIAGASDAAIRIDGASTGVIRASRIHDNSGRGLDVTGSGAVRLVATTIQEGSSAQPGPRPAAPRN